MTISKNIVVGAITPQYGTVNLLHTTILDKDHVPYNKRRGEVKSRAELDVAVHRNANWVEMRMTEHVESGKSVRSRTISMNFTREELENVLKLMNGNLPDAA